LRDIEPAARVLIHLTHLSFMKRTILALAAFVLAFVSARADDSAAQPPATQPQVEQSAAKVSVQASTEDAFLQFALEKAKQYTGVVEDAVSKAIDVASQEAKPMMEEYLRWKAWYHGAWACVGGVIFVVPLFFFLLGIWGACHRWSEDAVIPLYLLGGIATVIGGIFGLGTMFGNLMSFIQIQVVPRIYLIEQLRELLK
jgi:hypothetical protein